MANNEFPITECDGCGDDVALNGECDETLIGGDCDSCGYYTTRYLDEFQPKNGDIYEFLENGGSVHRDIRDLSYEGMEDYFGDMDPAEFL